MAALAPADYAGSVAIATQATQEVGELFQYDVGQATIPRGQAAMIPFVGAAIPAQRVSIYDPATHPRHPLSGVRLTNQGERHLAPGPITVFDGSSYAGDARLASTAPGQERLIGFALDQRVAVETRPEAVDQVRTVGRISNGVLHVRVERRQARSYRVDNQGTQAKQVVIQHARSGGHDLHDTPKPIETTAQHHRFQVTVKAGGTETVRVIERRIDTEYVSLAHVGDPAELSLWLDQRDLSPAARTALQAVQKLAGERHAALKEAALANQQVESNGREQGRTRENLRSVPQGSDFAKRLLDKLSRLDAEIDAQRQRADTQTTLAEAKRRELEQAVASLNVD